MLFKNISRTMAFAFVGMTTTAALADGGEVVNVAAQEIYIPNGFDTNDEIVVVLDGYLPDGCHKLTKPVVERAADGQAITITQKARRFPGPCIKALIPYTSVADLGQLKEGTYKVSAGDANDLLNVKASSNAGPDDAVYAAVDRVSVSAELDPSKPLAVLEGRLTNTCMKLIKPTVTNSGKTIEVLPALQIENRDDCREVETDFRLPIELPELKVGRYLLHVRSQNGQSVNTVFSVYQKRPE